jgi:ribosomal protein L11 methyltransferase
MDPGMAFGTGLHPTTRACLRLLLQVRPMPPRVLDVGTGSGILALAALRLGAEHADCLDTDAVAVATAQANAATNGLADRLQARQGTLPDNPDGAAHPLVLANLVAAVLVSLARPLAAHTEAGGTLLAAGIIDERAAAVTAALEDAGFSLAERVDDGEWVALRMIRA